MQFEQLPGGGRTNLPRPSIDTGMGLERITAVLQGTHDNYETDLFRHLTTASAEASHTAVAGPHAVSHRVIADHLRASCFLIADGVLPSNEGRGYVLRRIMRRAMRHAHILGSKDPLMYRLVPALVAEMGEAFSELSRAQALVTETLRIEETRFRETLARGLKLLDEATDQIKDGVLPGEIAFKLYDTYGFPLDLTEDALRARNLGVDTDGFQAAMQRQKAEARKAWAGSGEAATESAWFALREEFGPTEFLGYDTEIAEGVITAILVNGARVDRAEAGTEARILTNQTPFYGESGGQIGDRGAMFSAKGAEGEVTETEKKLGELHVHVLKVTRGAFAVGDAVNLHVDGERRRATRANHSATHLLHAALKHVLGPHVAQKGSYVGPDRLRFDFAHPKAMTPDELERVEDEVNAVLRQNTDVLTRLMPTSEAIKAGAVAMFGEKYGDEVRVLAMGHDRNADGKSFSVELCGGTHVRRLGDIGLFTILSESAVASGVRRIEALTSEGARRYLGGQAHLAREAAAVLRTSPAELAGRVSQLFEERRRLERELSEAKKALALAGPSRGNGSDSREIGGLKTVFRVVEDVAAKDLKSLADEAKAKLGSGVVAFVAVSEGKASVVVGVTPDLTARVNAVDLVRAGAEALGGKGGGGRPDMAQAGGPDGTRAKDALAAIEQRLSALAPTA
jgi:alanyl-tRNA synthetase